MLKLTGLDSQWLVVLCPKLLQALLTALGEAALCRAIRYRTVPYGTVVPVPVHLADQHHFQDPNPHIAR